MGVSMLVLFPLTFLSNVFVDPSTMPGWLQAFVEVNPISLLVTATRQLMHGRAEAWDVGLAVVICVAIFAIFAPITMRIYKHKQ